MPDQAGKLSSERNGGYTRPKGPFHRVAGLAVNCPPLGPPVAQAQPRGRTASMWESSSAVLCVHNTAGLVSSSGWVHCVHCTVCTMCTLYTSVYIVHCTVCTLKTLTASLAWPKPRQIYSYLFWTRQNVVFNYSSVLAKLSFDYSSVLITAQFWLLADYSSVLITSWLQLSFDYLITHSASKHCSGSFQNIPNISPNLKVSETDRLRCQFLRSAIQSMADLKTRIASSGTLLTSVWKPTLKTLTTIFFYIVKHTCIKSLDKKGFFPSFKTLDLAAVQSFAENSPNINRGT